ncbi:pilus assembly protein TadG-related protein [Allosphingosinicella sp.]|uniref:pilus assembly protein TadG-related protein n=1 Tax=Allosphingosinicella sp. TaxID=2823234 RepID=UPI002EFBB57B
MGLLNALRKLIRDENGNALAMGAAAMPLVIAGAGLALDSIQISLTKRQLQRSADSAALAGAHALVQERVPQDGVTRDLELNNEVTLNGAAVVENAPLTGAFAGNERAVRVQLSAQRSLSFLSFFGANEQAITVEATAAIVREGEFCMLSLEDGDATGVEVGGNATINIGCGISTNSRSTEAIRASGSSVINATPIMAVGAIPASSNFGSSQIIPYTPVQEDPFDDLPVPSPTNCVDPPVTHPNSTPTVINTSSPEYNSSDGSICYNGLDIQGAVTFDFAQPTIVYINGGELGFGAQAQVTGQNVVFVLTSTNATTDPSSIATLNQNGGADIDITAPTSGPWSGIALYEDRRAPVGRTTNFNGNASSAINGAMYFPQAYFHFNGTADMQATCIQLVARRLDFRGNGTIRNSCDEEENGIRNFTGTYVRLVG